MAHTFEMAGKPSARWALVLAGGDGTRLQELTRLIAGAPIPKQYCRIQKGHSLLEATVHRIAPLAPPARTLAIVNNDHLRLAREQLTGLPPDNLLVQPYNRDTGPGILFALLALAKRDPTATVAVFPSDHYVGDPDSFLGHVERAISVVDELPQRIALLGIRPDWPDPSLGYIEPGTPLPLRRGGVAFGVSMFREKPGAQAAIRIIGSGGLWNSFVMVSRVARMLELIASIRPADYANMRNLAASGSLVRNYHRLDRWSFSTDFISHTAEHLVVVEADGIRWSDWGTREAIERTFASLNQVPPWHSGASWARTMQTQPVVSYAGSFSAGAR
jgi:mannose-1-phosphate guanylyltransferase